MKIALAFLSLSLCLCACTCGDPCDPDTEVPRCEEGNVVATCPQPGVDQIVGANRWIRKACTAGEQCISSGGLAFCAISTEPNGACDGGVSQACEDVDTFLYCTEGFATARYDCLRCDSNDAGVTCVGGPSARCAGSTDCASGNCGSNGFCRKADGGR